MNYADSYNFCFPNEYLWRELVDAQKAGDGLAINQVVQAQYDEIGAGVRQYDGIATDPDIFVTRSRDLSLLSEEPDFGTVGSYQDELELVWQLSTMRDQPLSSLPSSLPETLTTVSWFLRDKLVNAYAAGEDFGGEQEHNRVYAGLNPTGVLNVGNPEPITTGRHFAALVHKDHPVVEAINVIGQLFSEGIEHRNCPQMEDTRGLTRFASIGIPFLTGAMGEVLRRVGLVSFREKWTKLQPRPAQSLAMQGRYLPWGYPEAHPTHCSRNSMHFIAYSAMAGYIKYVFNKYQTLPSGRTVEEEIDLWVGNFGAGRLWPGVHTELDNAPYKMRAESLGVKIAKEHLK